MNPGRFGHHTLDAMAHFTSSERRTRTVPVEIKKRISPRTARQFSADEESLVVAPYLSRSVRDVLKERGISYVDQTGNARVILDEPGLFILTSGADSNPSPDNRRTSLRGIKAGRVVRILAGSKPPLGVRELAQLADTDAGYVSRLLKMLDDEAIVERSSRGEIEDVDWRRLLTQWADDTPIAKRSEATTWLSPRGLKSVEASLQGAGFRYLLTGSAVASRIAPVAPTRLLSVYVDDPNETAENLGLRRTDSGANVILLQPDDEAIFENGAQIDGLRYASLPLVVADLLSGPGRLPAEAEALMDWMEQHEEAWRG